MTNVELKGLMETGFKQVNESIKTLTGKVDPLTKDMARLQGALSMLKWMVGVGFSALLIIIALLELSKLN